MGTAKEEGVEKGEEQKEEQKHIGEGGYGYCAIRGVPEYEIMD